MVASLHDGLTELLRPDLSAPVTNGQEVFELGGVTLKSIDGAVMLAVLLTITHVNFNLVLTTIGLHHGTVLATAEILHW